jgi:hypothetical protein
MPRSRGWTGWADLIPAERWSVYQRFMESAILRRITFALGGACATATHTGCWRDTNDMDIYILPEDRERVVELTEQIGLKDIHEQYPYDHDWTYRATDGTVIVEAIWRMRNHRADVDAEWLERSTQADLRSIRTRIAPPEEMIWAKLYVLMRERCDWPDILNYLYYCADGLDWQHLFDRLGEDAPLLGAVLTVFSWISPDRTSSIPQWVWEKVGLRVPETIQADDDLRRALLLSTRQWYGPMSENSKLEKSR